MFEFKITARSKKNKARAGEFITPHGILKTPELSIVATDGHIKGIDTQTHNQLPLHYNIVNTFHIYTKNILPEIEKKNGIHRYGNFQSVLASDSGGFQVFSLGFGKTHQVGKIGGMFPEDTTSLRGVNNNERRSNPNNEIAALKSIDARNDENNPLVINDDGVTFAWNGEKITLTPEKSMDIQHRIGADIMFAFDECTSPLNSKEYTAKALKRTHAWIKRCISAHNKINPRTGEPWNHTQALFAIVQGGYFKDLRLRSAKYMAKQDVPGFGIGGSLGKTKQDMEQILEWTLPCLPDEKPRHLLGIGQVRDIFEAVERGIDLFDCVIPTREARHKIIYSRRGKITVRKSRATDEVIDKKCRCITCAQEKITLTQLADLFTNRDPNAFFYATIHNIQFFADLMAEIRNAITTDSLEELKAAYYKVY